jgi:hypothetical protein
MQRIFLSALAALPLAFCPRPAAACAKMFPAGFSSAPAGPPLPTRLVRAEASVRYGLAVVKNEFRFENKAYEPIEGLLRARLPRNAVVTDFAYYFKGVRVAGRILEKEEAEQIYRAITAAGRDPALLRHKDDGTYEARIFPIEARSEIRVELEYRYALPEYSGRLKFLYPLTAARTGRPIDRVEVQVTFAGDRIARIAAAPGSASLAGSVARVDFSATTVDALRDLGASAFLRADAPRAQLLSGPQSPEGGFLGLRLRGVGARGSPGARRMAALAAMGARRVCSAPHTDGSHTRYWFGRSTHAPPARRVGIPLARLEAEDLAAPWAHAFTLALTAEYRRTKRRQTRDAVVALSRQYRIDTAFTTYLAVPDSEWAAYQDRMDEARRRDVEHYLWEAEQRRIVVQLPRWVVPGDPVIRVPHQPDLEQVLAVLPDGDILPLRLDAARGIWEGRFDIPEGAAEGDYAITVILLERGGRRSELTLVYRVDLTPPAGSMQATVQGRLVRVEVTASSDVARAVALLPGSDEAPRALAHDPATGRFRADLSLSPGRHTVRVRLYDRVHNWVEMETEVDAR